MIPDELPTQPEPGSLEWRAQKAREGAGRPTPVAYAQKVQADADAAKAQILSQRNANAAPALSTGALASVTPADMGQPVGEMPPAAPVQLPPPPAAPATSAREPIPSPTPSVPAATPPAPAPAQGPFDSDAPYGRDAQGRPYSLPPGTPRTPEQQKAFDEQKRTRASEIKQKQAMAEAEDAARREENRQKRLDELESKRKRNEAEAALQRSWNDKIRARMGLPPLSGATGTGMPAGAAGTPGAPMAPQTAPRAPVAPPAVNPRPPMTAPSVSAVGQMPPMQTVRTLDGDYRRQTVNGTDNAVPLVELTDSGSFVPNANALGVDDWKAAYTQRDSLAVADMIRQSNDPMAKREQQRIDANRRAIMASAKLSPDQRKAALDQLNSQQGDLHYGFLQSQGVGSGVRAGFGDMSPQAPTMEMVYSLMDRLRSQYRNATETQLYQLALSMASEAGSRAQMNGQLPATVWQAQNLQDAELGMARQEEAVAESKRVQQVTLELQSKGMDPQEASAAAEALSRGDTKTAQDMFVKSSERKALSSAREKRAPISASEIDKQIQAQVLGADAAYQSQLQRYLQLTKAKSDPKVQGELGLYPGTPEWVKAFEGDKDEDGRTKPSEYQQLDESLRKALSDAMQSEKNREKATAQIREAKGSTPFYEFDSMESQMAMIDIMRMRASGNDRAADAALNQLFPDAPYAIRELLKFKPGSEPDWSRILSKLEQDNQVPGLAERMRRWGITAQ